MERQRPPANASPDTGRLGFRYPHEPEDERPVLALGACRCRACRDYDDWFWHDGLERGTYEAAVSLNPRRSDEGPMAYARRISEIVLKDKAAGLKSMPKAGRVRL